MLSKQTIANIYVKAPEVNAVQMDEYFHDAIEVLNKNRWGAVFVVDKANKLQGILTDGDARRIFTKNQEPMAQLNSQPISKFMNAHPTTVTPETKVLDLLVFMNEKSILCAPVVGSVGEFLGVIHLQHLVGESLKYL